jgi:large subunit ribosomal protein L4e
MKSVQMVGMDGKPQGELKLPSVFSTEVNEGLVARAAISDQTKKYQPKGSYIWAGLETSARYRGRKEDYGSNKNRGMAKLPHEIQPGGKFGKVKRIPSAVKGRRAFPPKVETRIIEEINKKEYAVALKSAIAATANENLVKARGHALGSVKVPIVVSKDAENVAKTKDVQKMLLAIGIGADLERARKVRRRSGVGSRKGGKRYPKSAIVIATKDSKLLKAARNIAGVDVADVEKLSVLSLAPGAKAGRLAIYTQGAIEKLSAM